MQQLESLAALEATALSSAMSMVRLGVHTVSRERRLYIFLAAANGFQLAFLI
jgi:hypothetical protein